MRRNIRIGQNYYDIRQIDDNYMEIGPIHVTTTLQTAPQFDSTLNIMSALNDDCLREIFESSVLDLRDLAAIGSVCTRFRRIVKRIHPVTSISSTNENRLDVLFHNKPYNDDSIRMLCRLDHYFHTFGASLTHVDLNRLPHQQVLYGILMEHCEKLTSLTCQVNDRWTLHELRLITAKLKKLHLSLEPKSIPDLRELLDGNTSLEMLEINAGNAGLKCPDINLSKLIDLRLHRVRLDEISTKAFFTRNTQLQKLTVHNCYLCDGFEDMLKCLSNLKELSYIYYDWLFHPYKKRKLFVHVPGNIHHSILALIFSQAPLEKLVIKYPEEMSSAIHSICQMTSIKYLDVTLNFPDEMIQLIQSLDNLIEVRIESEQLTIHHISLALSQAHEKLAKASFQVIRLWDDEHLMGTDDDLIALQELATNCGIDVDITVKKKFGGKMVSLLV